MMSEFIIVIKCLATILITNSHYGNVWPVSFMAMGGLMGNTLFFGASGFCLYEIKQPFVAWYKKRIVRIYPVLWITNIIGLVIGFHNISTFKGFFKLFIYPTYYHFIQSIMILYAVYYVLIYFHKKLRVEIKTLMIVAFVTYLLIYGFVYDKSHYHIDVVEEPMVRFLYLEAMLLGAYYRQKGKSKEIGKQIGRKEFGKVVICFGVYTVSKLMFSFQESISDCQIINPILLFLTVVCIFDALYRWEFSKKKALESYRIGKIVKYLSEITLEIYLIQYFVIQNISQMIFPINLVVVSGMIVLAASGVHFLGKNFFKMINRFKE